MKSSCYTVYKDGYWGTHYRRQLLMLWERKTWPTRTWKKDDHGIITTLQLCPIPTKCIFYLYTYIPHLSIVIILTYICRLNNMHQWFHTRSSAKATLDLTFLQDVLNLLVVNSWSANELNEASFVRVYRYFPIYNLDIYTHIYIYM